MVSLNVNNLAKQFTPSRWRFDELFMKFLYALVAPVNALYQDLLIYKAEKEYELSFNSQTIYLEHYLNDLLDNSLRRIYIENDTNLIDHFIFQNSEGLEPIWTSRNWKSSVSYSVGNIVTRKGLVYSCQIAGTNNPPELNSGHWAYQREGIILSRNEEYEAQVGYTVYLPTTYTAVVHQKDTVVMKDDKVWKAKQVTSASWVQSEWHDYTPYIKSKYNKYNAAGSSYLIETT